MRIYMTAIEAVKEIERELYEMGISSHPNTYQDVNVKDNPDFDTRELLNYSYSVTSPLIKLWKLIGEFGLSGDYITEEICERTSGVATNPGASWERRREVWEPFLHQGKFAYTYSERLQGQLNAVARILKESPDSRQAVVPIYWLGDNFKRGGQSRVPCSMFYQFVSREISGVRRLDLTYVMRSCDFYTHFMYDMVLAILLQERVAGYLDQPLGVFSHFITSLHAFRKDWKQRPNIF